MTVLLASNQAAHWSTPGDFTAGRYDGNEVPYGMIMGDETRHGMRFRLPDFDPADDECWFSFDWYKSGGGNATDDGYMIRCFDVNGNENFRGDMSNGYLFFSLYGTGTTNTGSVFLTSGVRHMKIRYKWAATLELDFFYNDVLIGSISGANNVRAAPHNFTFDMIDASVTTDRLSQFICSKVDLQNFGMKMTHVNALGSDNNFSGDVTTVNDHNFTTGMTATGVSKLQSFTKPAITTAKAIHAYTPNCMIYCGNTPRTVRMYLRIGGVKYNGQDVTLRVAEQNYVHGVWNVDPSDGLPWTDAKINAAEIGIEVVS